MDRGDDMLKSSASNKRKGRGSSVNMAMWMDGVQVGNGE